MNKIVKIDESGKIQLEDASDIFFLMQRKSQKVQPVRVELHIKLKK